MPGHYEMLVSHSPPVFSHSPPAGFLADYSAAYLRYQDPTRGYCRPQKQLPVPTNRSKSLNALFAQSPIAAPTSPKRSCLVIRNVSDTNDTDDDGQHILLATDTENRIKKKVVFADDQGLSLTEVRVMSEPSNVPPLWSIRFLAQVTQGLINPIPPEQWTVEFRQPASDYLEFRRRLDTGNVSLENVIVKENDAMVVGTVKVRNLGFQKEVIVRATWDSWKTQEDIYCTYSQVGGPGSAYVIYDTFSFKIPLPPHPRKLEFCICFRCNDVEYWDNNNNKNYILSKKISSSFLESQSLHGVLEQNINGNRNQMDNRGSNPMSIKNQYEDLTKAKIGSWSEFASWTHLENKAPYW